MDICANCGRPRKLGAAFCTACGYRFTDDNPYKFLFLDPAKSESAAPVGQPYAGHAVGGLRSPRWRVAAVAVVVLAAVSAAGILLPARHHGSSAEAAQDPGAQPDQHGSVPAPGPPGPRSAGQVVVSADAERDASASSVAVLLGRYFNAINARDYQSYISLLSPRARQGLTAEVFDRGYRSTADSAETLVRISAARNGDIAADVMFTSRQDPADSPDRTQSCTDWDIVMYLERDGPGYLIDRPPPGYHASYAACV